MGDIVVTILMPCLNEAETLRECIRKASVAISSADLTGEILVADNGSVDGSTSIAMAEGVRLVQVPIRGYGAALVAGIEVARGKYILMADADDSYDFGHLPRFVVALDQGADLVMGNRFRGGIAPHAMPLLHRYLGNPVLSFIGRLFFGVQIGDFHCGMRAFRKDSIQGLGLRTTGMEFASEMVVKASLAGLKITEVPTTLSPDGRTRSPHLHTWRDGWRHLRLLLLYSPRWLFFYPGLVAAVVGFSVALWLLPGERAVGSWHFDVDTLTYAIGLMMTGVHVCIFAFIAKVFGMSVGLLPPDKNFQRLFRHITLETGILVGVLLLAFGLGSFGYSFSLWRGTGFGPLDATRILRITLPSAAALMLGVEVVFASFVLSLLGIDRR